MLSGVNVRGCKCYIDDTVTYDENCNFLFVEKPRFFNVFFLPLSSPLHLSHSSPAATPSPSGSFQQVSSPGSYQPTPSPQGYQHSSSPSSFHGSTPSPSGYPLTPVAPSPIGFNPATPGMANPLDPSQTEWHTADIEVKIKESHEDDDLIYKHGVIRGMSVSKTA